MEGSMKKTKVLALILAATMLASCSKAPASETTAEKETETTTEETTEASAEDATEETTTTEETTAAPTPTPEPVAFDPHLVDPADNGNVQHDLIMAKVDELEAQQPGGSYYLRYDLDSSTLDSAPVGYWILFAVTSEGSRAFAMMGGELCELTNLAPTDEEIELAIPYEVFTAVPFLYPTNPMSHFPDTDYFPATIEDGTYGGVLMGVSDDGTTALVQIGTLIAFDRDEIMSLEIGDPIGYEDLVIMGKDPGSNDSIYIPVSDGQLPLALVSLGDDPDSPLYLKYESDTFVYEDVTVAILPISQTAEINSYFSGYGDEPEGYENITPTGNPMLDSYFWFYYESFGNGGWFSGNNNGWHAFNEAMEPIVVSNNEIVSITLAVP